jgi:hypothetical protein
MYQEHPDFDQPDNTNGRVWRYMDFVKCVSLLQSRSLYFARSDKLGDRFEGSYPRMNVANLMDLCTPETRETFRKNWGQVFRKWRECMAINFWHLNDHESAAMWQLYIKSNHGIAVQSTYAKLRDCFKDTE